MNKIKITNLNGKTLCPEGVHNAVLAAIYDIGIQPGYKGGPQRHKRVYIYETDKLIENGALEGQPHWISEIIADSYHDKSTLKKRLNVLCDDLTLEELQNGELDLDTLIGKAVMVTVRKDGTNGDIKTRIDSVSKHDGKMPVLIPKFNPNQTPEWIVRMRETALRYEPDHLIKRNHDQGESKQDNRKEDYSDWTDD